MLEFFNFYIDVDVDNIWLTLFNIYGVVKYQSLCVQESCQPVITAELVARYQQLVRQHGAGFWWTLSALRTRTSPSRPRSSPSRRPRGPWLQPKLHQGNITYTYISSMMVNYD